MEPSRARLFEAIVREHELGLLAFVRSCVHDGADADDIVQETFLAAWRRFDEYDSSRPLAAWLRGIARNKVLEYFRSAATARRHVRVLTPETLGAIADEFEQLSPGRAEAFPRTLAALRDCLQILSPEEGEIIRAVYREQRPCRSIAEQLGHSVAAVQKQLQRARARLRDCIAGKLKPESVYV